MNLRSQPAWYVITLITVILLMTMELPMRTKAANLPPFPTPPPNLPAFPTPRAPNLPNFPGPPNPTPKDKEDTLEGAKIVLHVMGKAAPGQSQAAANEALWQTYFWQDMYTVVQWQEDSGTWQDVTGWRGTLDTVENAIGEKSWWFSEVNFGTGPFRWGVYAHEHGEQLALSEVFTLPTCANSALYVTVEIAP